MSLLEPLFRLLPRIVDRLGPRPSIVFLVFMFLQDFETHSTTGRDPESKGWTFSTSHRWAGLYDLVVKRSDPTVFTDLCPVLRRSQPEVSPSTRDRGPLHG